VHSLGAFVHNSTNKPAMPHLNLDLFLGEEIGMFLEWRRQQGIFLPQFRAEIPNKSTPTTTSLESIQYIGGYSKIF
jgi:hypothetical protein